MAARISGLIATAALVLTGCGGGIGLQPATIVAVERCSAAEGLGESGVSFTTGVAEGPDGVRQTVQVFPTDVVSEDQAARLNQCIATALSTPVPPTPAPRQSRPVSAPEPVVPPVSGSGFDRPSTPLPVFAGPSSCQPGSGVLQGGAGYCVGR